MKRDLNLFEQAAEATATLLEKSVALEKSLEKSLDRLLEGRTDALKQPTQTQPAHPAKKGSDPETRSQIKRIIEALLFASSDPVPFQKMREIASTTHSTSSQVLASVIAELEQEYLFRKCAFQLDQIAGGFILRTREEYSSYLKLLGDKRRQDRLSHAAMEVLAIIAYRQPITRPQIEAIRGVDCSGTLHSLTERGLVESTGKLEAPGRPSLYGVTQRFLQHFGLRDLQALPQTLPSLKI